MRPIVMVASVVKLELCTKSAMVSGTQLDKLPHVHVDVAYVCMCALFIITYMVFSI